VNRVPPTGSPLAIRHAWAPWSGLILGALGWVLHHQLGSDLVMWNCRLGGPLLTAGLGVVCGAFAALGGWISWRAADEAPGRPLTPSKRFVGLLCAAAAALFTLTIVVQSVAGFVYDGCER
jgi:hypothetical protein